MSSGTYVTQMVTLERRGKRKEHFNYFHSLAYPYVGITSEVDITEFYHYVKSKEYPFCATSHTVAKEDGTYAYCTLDARKNLQDFLEYASGLQEQAKMAGNIEEDAAEALSLIFVSTVP